MGAVLGFFRLLMPSWLVQNRTATRQSRRRGSRRSTVTSISHSGSSSCDDCSFSSCYSRSHGHRSIGARRDRSLGNSTFLNHSLAHRKERVPDVFTGTKGSLKDWLRHFETCARWNGWDYAERGVNLAMSLRGNAQQVLGELSVHELEDFDAIKAALERRFDPAEKENLHRVEFRSRFKKKGESVTEYGFALNRIASDAYPRMPPEARETIVIDQFVSGLPSKDLRRHVQFHHPSSIHEAIALASEFESFEERFDGRKPENTEKGNDTSVRSISKKDSVHEELLKVFQSLSKQVAESLDKVTKAVGQISGNKSRNGSVVCFRCNEKGHYSRQCPTTALEQTGSKNAFNENAPGKENWRGPGFQRSDTRPAI